MSHIEAAASGDVACLNELIKFVIQQGNADQLEREHRPDRAGHCPTCHSKGCTVYAAACAAKHHIAQRKLQAAKLWRQQRRVS